MEKETLRKEIARILELPLSAIADDFDLLAFEKWDSMARIELLTFIDSEFEVLLKATDMRKCANLNAICALLEAAK